ncbi:MAG: hypothetical protein L0Z50_28235 [Verrucomicrobiales bacterium]|nr:hypothetical protein [Verrucomicrobiales bacterium]
MDLLVAAALVLGLAQVALGTGLVFAQLIFLFLVLAGMAVNALGGCKTLAGLCVAMMGLKIVIISQVAKTILLERADEHLENPIETAGVLVVGMAAIGTAALFVQRFHPRQPIFKVDNSVAALRRASIITFGIGLVSCGGSLALGGAGEGIIRVGGVVGVLRQLAFCSPLSIAFSTAYVLVRSNGTRCLSLWNGIPIFSVFALGLIYSSKQGMFEPFFILAATAVAFQFRFRAIHVISAISLLVFSVFVLAPLAQMARSTTRSSELAVTVREMQSFLKEHFHSGRAISRLMEEQRDSDTGVEFSYYHQPHTLLDRVSLIKMVDVLVTETRRDGTSGWQTVTHGFKMLLPRAIYRAKPAIGTGTFLGHKAKVLSEDDGSTQISFGFIADAFSSFGWWGAALIPFLLTGTFFAVFGLLVGPIDRNVWCVFLFSQFQHTFTELPIAGMTLSILQQPLIIFTMYALLNFAGRMAQSPAGSCGERAPFDLGTGKRSSAVLHA